MTKLMLAQAASSSLDTRVGGWRRWPSVFDRQFLAAVPSKTLMDAAGHEGPDAVVEHRTRSEAEVCSA